MINRYAIVENGVVTNVILWDEEATVWQPPTGSTAYLLPANSPVAPKWTFDGTNYSAPTS